MKAQKQSLVFIITFYSKSNAHYVDIYSHNYRVGRTNYYYGTNQILEASNLSHCYRPKFGCLTLESQTRKYSTKSIKTH